MSIKRVLVPLLLALLVALSSLDTVESKERVGKDSIAFVRTIRCEECIDENAPMFSFMYRSLLISTLTLFVFIL